MTPTELRRCALSLPDTHEEPHFDRTSFRVGTRIFATMTSDGEEAMVKVPSPEHVDALLSTYPKVFFSYGGWTTRGGALGVRLAKVKTAMMTELVTAAWEHVTSKGKRRPRAKKTTAAAAPTPKSSGTSRGRGGPSNRRRGAAQSAPRSRGRA